jgi:medium-chain acyl-[acyl-carrier-protein] hydrolase
MTGLRHIGSAGATFGESRDPWFPYRRAASRRRSALSMFCIGYAGAGASVFHTWVRALEPTVDVYPVQLPGRENRYRERPFTQMDPLLAGLVEALRPYVASPFVLFGHSVGALVAWELARRLRREDLRAPAYLIVSAHRAPSVPCRDPPLHGASDDALISYLRQLNGTREGVFRSGELLSHVLPILRADLELHETHVPAPEPPLECPVAAFGGAADPRVSPPELEPWARETTGPFSLRLFAGDHFFLHTARPAVLAEVDALCAILRRS